MSNKYGLTVDFPSNTRYNCLICQSNHSVDWNSIRLRGTIHHASIRSVSRRSTLNSPNRHFGDVCVPGESRRASISTFLPCDWFWHDFAVRDDLADVKKCRMVIGGEPIIWDDHSTLKTTPKASHKVVQRRRQQAWPTDSILPPRQRHSLLLTISKRAATMIPR